MSSKQKALAATLCLVFTAAVLCSATVGSCIVCAAKYSDDVETLSGCIGTTFGISCWALMCYMCVLPAVIPNDTDTPSKEDNV